MTEYTQPVEVIHKVSCDSCDQLEESGEVAAANNPLREYVAELVAKGWSIYSGRTRRHYCPNPECGPRHGHRMRLVAGHEATVVPVRATTTRERTDP